MLCALRAGKKVLESSPRGERDKVNNEWWMRMKARSILRSTDRGQCIGRSALSVKSHTAPINFSHWTFPLMYYTSALVSIRQLSRCPSAQSTRKSPRRAFPQLLFAGVKGSAGELDAIVSHGTVSQKHIFSPTMWCNVMGGRRATSARGDNFHAIKQWSLGVVRRSTMRLLANDTGQFPL